MRIAIDTGGTFTDLIYLDQSGNPQIYKAPTTPNNPAIGILDVIGLAADDCGISVREMLSKIGLIVHGTTHALNAVITGKTARTALLVTHGHPDILTLREGGKSDPFDVRAEYPRPYIPRNRTFEVRERILATGEVAVPLDEVFLDDVVTKIAALDIEAIAVSLLWSIVNSDHECRVGEILNERLPHVAVTLGHKLNPCVREFRRTSSAAIDASLKPVMSRYMSSLESHLRGAGFGGVIRIVTSRGGTLRAEEICDAPIHALNSGPATAPIIGRAYATTAKMKTAVVIDSGGTTFDMSLIRDGRIPWTREKWIGPTIEGLMTGFPSVDVQSIGAGGGSIAWVDTGGLLHVGPESAGSVPGPACYGKGGFAPTVTDAALVLGYLNVERFLGGRQNLSLDAARQAISDKIAVPLAMDVDRAAQAILDVTTEMMAQAIESIALNHGADLSKAAIIAGGGAGGLNAVRIAERLGCPLVVVPAVAPAISAAGALIAPLMADFEETWPVKFSGFDSRNINHVLSRLSEKARAFLADLGVCEGGELALSCEARYVSENWEIEVPLPQSLLNRFDLGVLRTAFDNAHEAAFGIRDASRDIQFLMWRIRASSGDDKLEAVLSQDPTIGSTSTTSSEWRQVYFPPSGWQRVHVVNPDAVSRNATKGPLLVESDVTTVVVSPGDIVSLGADGSLFVEPVPHAKQRSRHRPHDNRQMEGIRACTAP